MSAKYILERFCREIPSTLGTILIDVYEGKAVASVTVDESFDLQKMTSVLSEVVIRHCSALDSLGSEPQKAQDLVLSTARGSLLIRVFAEFGNKLYAIALAVGRLANPSMARLVLATYEARLLEELQ